MFRGLPSAIFIVMPYPGFPENADHWEVAQAITFEDLYFSKYY